MFDFDPQSSGCIQAVVRRADRGALEISSGATKERLGCADRRFEAKERGGMESKQTSEV